MSKLGVAGIKFLGIIGVPKYQELFENNRQNFENNGLDSSEFEL